jgi:hypothetical protein
MRALSLVAFVLALAASACATTGSRAQLIESAKSGLSCPVDEMEVAMVSSSTHWVRGCGLVATFVLDCSVDTCTWRMQGKPVKRPTGK